MTIRNYIRMETPDWPTKNDPAILAVWREGALDTFDLAKRFHTTEAHVYSVIASRPAIREVRS